MTNTQLGFSALRAARQPLFLAVAALLLFTGNSRAAAIVSDWTGTGDGTSYNHPGNWNPATVPINDGDNYSIVIPTGQTVVFNVPNPGVGTNAVDQISLASGSTLTINPGRTLEVTDSAAIFGTLTVDNSTFNAPSAASLANSGKPRLLASGGGSLTLGASTLSGTYSESQTILSADGSGTLLALPSLSTLSVVENTGWADTLTIAASNSGVIDMSSLSSAALTSSSEDRLRFSIATGGNIDLSNLQTTSNTVFDVMVPSYSLASLLSANNTSFHTGPGAALSLPTLADINGGTHTVEAGASISAPSLATLRKATLAIDDSGSFSAPNVYDIQGTTITYTPGLNLTLGTLSEINSSRLFVEGGAVVNNISDSVLTGTYSESQEIFTADGSGSLLDMSSLTSVSLSENTGWSDTLSIVARNSGVVDLSNVSSATMAAGEDWLRFAVQSGGGLDLSNLQSTSRVAFDVGVASYSLPSLASAANTNFQVASGTTVNLASLTAQNGGRYTLASGSTVEAPIITSLNNVTLDLADTATFNAPMLTDFAGSTVTITPNTNFTPGLLSNINGARLFVEGGAVVSQVIATTFSGTYSESQEILVADGPGSVADLSSLTSMALSENTGWADTLSVVARNSGTIDLSQLSSVGIAGSEDVLRFLIQSGGHINMPSLQTASGKVSVVIEAEGSLSVGDLTVTPNLAISVADVTSTFDVNGSLLLDAGASLAIGTGGGATVSGNYSFGTTNEAAIAFSSGILKMDGAGTALTPQSLEVGGLDLGTPGVDFGDPTDVFDPFVDLGGTDNFSIGQLVVGHPGEATVVTLMDVIDNGNRASPEALYLRGLGGPNGLQLLGGSTLVIGNLNVYAFLNGSWVHLNDLFGPGQQMIPFSYGGGEGGGGFLALVAVPEPAAVALICICLLMMLIAPVACRR